MTSANAGLHQSHGDLPDGSSVREDIADLEGDSQEPPFPEHSSRVTAIAEAVQPKTFERISTPYPTRLGGSLTVLWGPLMSYMPYRCLAAYYWS